MYDDGGHAWKPQTYYVVVVKLGEHNVPHRAILYSGFLENGRPGSYSTIFNPTYAERCVPVSAARLIRVISEIPDMTNEIRLEREVPWIRRDEVDGQVRLVAMVPSQLMGDHAALFSDGDGKVWGEMGSERTLPPAIEALPAWSDERVTAVQAWHLARYEAAYAEILRRHPEAADGVRVMGAITIRKPPSP